MKSAKKLWLYPLVILGLALIALIACEKKDSNNDSDKVFVASGHPSWAPIMYQENNLIVGAAPELVTKIINDLGLKISVNYIGAWDVVQAKAKSGEVDLIVAAYKTAERETYMDYSVDYTKDPVSIFVSKGKTFPFAAWDELKGKKGVVTIGDSYGQEFDNYIKENLTVTAVATPDEAFAMLANNQADYFVYALYSGENFIASHSLNDQIVILPNYVSSENFYLTISKKSALIKYLPQINQLLEKYKADGTIDALIQKYKTKL